jgi:hypothetical protein
VAAVKGRLRYGLIHPDIRAAARGKVITLDTMKAFAEHPSQEAQREVYEALTKEDSYLQAYTVRQALISRGVQVSDDIGAFVREDYEARGGAIAADLLEEHSVLEDAALVETILLEKLRAAAEQARAKLGFAWADAMVRYDYATIRLATDGHSIRVFVRRASDYLIGGTYEVPSGLGGTFRVILKDACDTFAIVQNCGNCEDFDAMQPYRVPLDALMEIDDRRAA